MHSRISQIFSRRHTVEFAMLTDVGRVRGHNEDACAADEAAGRWVVCDGMGGAAGGEIASQMASRTFLETARKLDTVDAVEWRLEESVLAANSAVFGESQRDHHLRGMGTTLVALQVDIASRTAWTANVGDSRCYRMRGRVLEALTADHSFVDEQVRLGQLTEAEAALSPLRNVITRAVGSHFEVEVDVVQHSIERGDVFLLCSDGLTRELDDEEIAGVLAEGCDDLQVCANALVHMANEYGGGDNITVVLVRV